MYFLRMRLCRNVSFTASGNYASGIAILALGIVCSGLSIVDIDKLVIKIYNQNHGKIILNLILIIQR